MYISSRRELVSIKVGKRIRSDFYRICRRSGRVARSPISLAFLRIGVNKHWGERKIAGVRWKTERRLFPELYLRAIRFAWYLWAENRAESGSMQRGAKFRGRISKGECSLFQLKGKRVCAVLKCLSDVPWQVIHISRRVDQPCHLNCSLQSWMIFNNSLRFWMVRWSIIAKICEIVRSIKNLY